MSRIEQIRERVKIGYFYFTAACANSDIEFLLSEIERLNKDLKAQDLEE